MHCPDFLKQWRTHCPSWWEVTSRNSQLGITSTGDCVHSGKLPRPSLSGAGYIQGLIAMGVERLSLLTLLGTTPKNYPTCRTPYRIDWSFHEDCVTVGSSLCQALLPPLFLPQELISRGHPNKHLQTSLPGEPNLQLLRAWCL